MDIFQPSLFPIHYPFAFILLLFPLRRYYFTKQLCNTGEMLKVCGGGESYSKVGAVWSDLRRSALHAGPIMQCG